MPYRIAGIDVHKKVLAVVVSDVEMEGEFQFERRMAGSARRMRRRSPKVKPIQALWLLWLMAACVPHRDNCVMRSARVRTSSLSIDG